MALNFQTQTVFTNEPSAHAPPPAPAGLAPHFPQLEILECLGRGGMGVVYKARQPQLDRIVALKILAPERVTDARFADRFSKEARALAKLNHPNIVTIHDFGHAGGYFYLVMEFIDGLNLRQLLAGGRMQAREALAIVPAICEALQYAHDRGVIHRDIKPENILLDKEGRVKIADFGIARMMQDTAPEDPTIVGTPKYMAPEQAVNPAEADHRADIYSLGVVLYEMLTGELPGKSLEPPSHKVHIDVRLDEIVLRALEQKPELRFQQASILKTQVETIAGGGRPAETAKKSMWHYITPALAALICGMIGLASLVTALVIVKKIDLMAAEVQVRADAILHGHDLNDQQNVVFVKHWAHLVHLNRYLFKPLAVVGLAVAAGFGAMTLWRFWRRGGCGPSLSILFGSLSGCLGLWLFFFWPNPSSILVLAIPVASLLGLVLGISSRRSIAGKFGMAVSATNLAIWSLIATVTVFSSPSAGSLANSPWKLRSVSTPRLIEIGIAQPQLPWAWQELETRAQDSRLSKDEANNIVDSLAGWMRRDYAGGYNLPLNWIYNLLEELDRRHLVGDLNESNFLAAYHGDVRLAPISRVREGESSAEITCKLRRTWDQDLFGLAFLNSVRAITVDGHPVPHEDVFGHSWNQQDYVARLNLAGLSVGKHAIRCEVESAFVPQSAMPGLPPDAPPRDWPPGWHHWTRSASAELVIHPRDETLVQLSDDPALNPAGPGALQVNQIIVRRQGFGFVAVVLLTAKPRTNLPIALDVTLEMENRKVGCGQFWSVINPGGTMTTGGSELKGELNDLAPGVRAADIHLTPDPALLNSQPGADRIWNSEIVVSNVPLVRQDLDQAPESSDAFGPAVEVALPICDAGYSETLDLDGGKVVATPVMSGPWNWPKGSLPAGVMVVPKSSSTPDMVVATSTMIAPLPWQSDIWNSEYGLGEAVLASESPVVERETESATGATATGASRFPQSFIFKTVSGRYGLLQITGVTDHPRAAEVRYKFVQDKANKMESQYRFGPEKELDLVAGDSGTGEQFQFVNLGTGLAIASNKSVRVADLQNEANPSALMQWVRENRIDIGFGLVDDDGKPSPRLLIFQMGVLPYISDTVPEDRIPAFRSLQELIAYEHTHSSPATNRLVGPLVGVTNIWSDLTAGEMSDTKNGAPGFFLSSPLCSIMLDSGHVPSTIAFSTRDGTHGLLKILQFANHPPELKIRYKLVQKQGG